ncbi:hypothetical protein B0I21_10817 [Sphingobacterium paludis]|uniref:Uncharacterized protein n=1 Tax=Sphingobacterium paludis TaxID=1476465 RepID=A0A4R7CU59_9SPHI|nr:hypothetical protein B0I21_10817 [Sphingobacterium paludis]
METELFCRRSVYSASQSSAHLEPQTHRPTGSPLPFTREKHIAVSIGMAFLSTLFRVMFRAMAFYMVYLFCVPRGTMSMWMSRRCTGKANKCQDNNQECSNNSSHSKCLNKYCTNLSRCRYACTIKANNRRHFSEAIAK